MEPDASDRRGSALERERSAPSAPSSRASPTAIQASAPSSSRVGVPESLARMNTGSSKSDSMSPTFAGTSTAVSLVVASLRAGAPGKAGRAGTRHARKSDSVEEEETTAPARVATRALRARAEPPRNRGSLPSSRTMYIRCGIIPIGRLVFLPPHPLHSLKRGALMLASPRRPLLVQLVVTRRCNLACGYCSEYDDVSPPVEVSLLERRIDHIARLGTLILTFTGGEPLLHQKLDQLIARASAHGIVCTMISNGY